VTLYALFPIILRASNRFGAMHMLVAVGLASFVYRCGVALFVDPYDATGVYLLDLLPARWFEWCLGAALALNEGRALPRLLNAVSRARNVPLWLAAGMMLEWSRLGIVCADLAFGMGYLGMLRWATAPVVDPPAAPSSVQGALAAVGVISYSLYLAHTPIANLVFSWVPTLRLQHGGTAAAVVLAVTGSLLGAQVLYRFVEARFLGLTVATGDQLLERQSNSVRS
jgi:peptidoglycan/LPS O-acetylase OafA/YrhL